MPHRATTATWARSRPTMSKPRSSSGPRMRSSRSGAAPPPLPAISSSTSPSTHSSMTSAPTPTAGVLVLYGTLDGFIKARDADTGDLLWQFKLPSGVIGHPVTYEHRGKQYVAIYYGVGGWPGVGLVFDLTDPTAGLGAVGAFKELQKYTKMGGGMMVFSL